MTSQPARKIPFCVVSNLALSLVMRLIAADTRHSCAYLMWTRGASYLYGWFARLGLPYPAPLSSHKPLVTRPPRKVHSPGDITT